MSNYLNVSNGLISNAPYQNLPDLHSDREMDGMSLLFFEAMNEMQNDAPTFQQEEDNVSSKRARPIDPEEKEQSTARKANKFMPNQLIKNNVPEAQQIEPKYEGQLLNGIRHGQGKLTFANGAIYEGEFQNGKRHGQGKVTSPKGLVNEGEFQNGKLHGQGKVTRQGIVYEGELQNGKPHGQGKISTPDGMFYEGEYQNGKRHGQGKLTQNGRVYEGEFQNSKLHGQGKSTNQNGDVYEGQYLTLTPPRVT